MSIAPSPPRFVARTVAVNDDGAPELVCTVEQGKRSLAKWGAGRSHHCSAYSADHRAYRSTDQGTSHRASGGSSGLLSRRAPDDR